MNESSGHGGTNYFDWLPDEMLTKIFREFLDKLEDEDNFWNPRLNSTTSESVQSPSLGISYRHRPYDCPTDNSYFKVIRNFRESTADETLRNLCLTCKRFARIINGKYFTTPDSNQWPVLKIDSRKLLKRSYNCPHENNNPNNSSACHLIRTAANSKFMKYKALELCSFQSYSDLQSCIVYSIMDEEVNLSSVVELKIRGCVIPPLDLDLILSTLQNIKRVSICDLSFWGRSFSSREISDTLDTQLSGKDLSRLELNLGSYLDGHLLMDYIIDHLPAREVRINTSCREDYVWLNSYFKINKDIIRNFHITFQDNETVCPHLDELRLSVFQGFEYYVEEGNYERSVISSVETRSRPKPNLATVKYKRLEFFPTTLIVGRILKAILDNRACLSEVVELTMHRGTRIQPGFLSEILAALPKIERLNLCQKKGNLKITYRFFRENDPFKKQKTQEAADPVSSFLPQSYFDNQLSRDVHEHILANPPADNVRVVFKKEYSCECMPNSNLFRDKYPNASNRAFSWGSYAAGFFRS